MSDNKTCLQPAFDIVVCVLTLYNVHVPGFLRSPVLVRVAFCHETQQQNGLLKAEIY